MMKKPATKMMKKYLLAACLLLCTTAPACAEYVLTAYSTMAILSDPPSPVVTTPKTVMGIYATARECVAEQKEGVQRFLAYTKEVLPDRVYHNFGTHFSGTWINKDGALVADNMFFTCTQE